VPTQSCCSPGLPDPIGLSSADRLRKPPFHFIRGGLWTPNPTKERVTSPIGLQTNQYVYRIEFYRISNPVMLGSTLVVHHGVGRTVTRQRNVTSSAIKRKAAKQIAVSRTITSKPNQLDAVQRLCQEIYDHALASSAERDIKSFDFWKEPEEPVGIRARSSARPWPDAPDVCARSLETRNSLSRCFISMRCTSRIRRSPIITTRRR